MVLGPAMEENLRRSLQLSNGDPSVFFTRPISGGIMIATGVLLLIFIVPALRRRSKASVYEEDARVAGISPRTAAPGDQP
jgi:TctA family transporter